MFSDGMFMFTVAENSYDSGTYYTITSHDGGYVWTWAAIGFSVKAVACSSTGAVVATVTFGGIVHISFDYGGTWVPRVRYADWVALALSSNGTFLAAAVSGGSIFTSRNDGASWNTTLINRNWRTVSASSNGRQLVAGDENGQVFRSSDYGQTWDVVVTTALESCRSVASSLDGQIITVLMESGSLYKSLDGGSTWAVRESQKPWQGIAIAAYGGFAIAAVYGGELVVTADLGSNWNVKDQLRLWRAVCVSDAGGIMVAAAENDFLYVSDDLGTTWRSRASKQNWTAVASSQNGTRLTAVTNGGMVYVSSDKGVSWTARENNRTWSAIASSFDSSRLLGSVYQGFLYISVDFGLTWMPRQVNRPWTAVAVSYTGQYLYAAAIGSRLYASWDSGTTWFPRNAARSWTSLAVSFNGMKIIAGARNEYLYTSTDGGLSWISREDVRNWKAVATSADAFTIGAVVDGGRLYMANEELPLIFQLQSAPPFNTLTFCSDNASMIIGAVWDGLVHTTTDNGLNLQIRGSARKWKSVACTSGITKLAAAEDSGQIFFSSNAGLTWTARAHVDSWQTVAYHGSSVFAITKCSLYQSLDNGVSWTVLRSFVCSETAYFSSAAGLMSYGHAGLVYQNSSEAAAVMLTGLAVRSAAESANGRVIVFIPGFSAGPLGVIQDYRSNSVSIRYGAVHLIWASVATNVDGSLLLACPWGGHLYTSRDFGVTWRAHDVDRFWGMVLISRDGMRAFALSGDSKLYSVSASNIGSSIYITVPSPSPSVTVTMSATCTRSRSVPATMTPTASTSQTASTAPSVSVTKTMTASASRTPNTAPSPASMTPSASPAMVFISRSPAISIGTQRPSRLPTSSLPPPESVCAISTSASYNSSNAFLLPRCIPIVPVSTEVTVVCYPSRPGSIIGLLSVEHTVSLAAWISAGGSANETNGMYAGFICRIECLSPNTLAVGAAHYVCDRTGEWIPAINMNGSSLLLPFFIE
jgi:hypothetical protein